MSGQEREPERKPDHYEVLTAAQLGEAILLWCQQHRGVQAGPFEHASVHIYAANNTFGIKLWKPQ